MLHTVFPHLSIDRELAITQASLELTMQLSVAFNF